MPYSITWINSGAIVSFEGTLNFEIVKEVAGKLVENEYFDKLLFQVWDFRNITNIAISQQEALPSASLAKASTIWSGKQMVAILAKINPRIRAFFSIFESVMKMTDWKCALFDDKKTIVRWLMAELGDDLIDSNPALLNDFRFIYY